MSSSALGHEISFDVDTAYRDAVPVVSRIEIPAEPIQQLSVVAWVHDLTPIDLTFLRPGLGTMEKHVKEVGSSEAPKSRITRRPVFEQLNGKILKVGHHWQHADRH